MAALKERPVRSAAPTLAAALALAGALLASPSTALAQEGTPVPTPAPTPNCSDRFPAEGPAGVDLRLGCIVGELVGLYTASSRDDPPTLSAYVLVTAGSAALGVVLVLLALRLVTRRAARRLAPVTPSEWWICPSCHSVNATAASRCYACGSPPGDGPTLPTDRAPRTPQSLGGSSPG